MGLIEKGFLSVFIVIVGYAVWMLAQALFSIAPLSALAVLLPVIGLFIAIAVLFSLYKLWHDNIMPRI